MTEHEKVNTSADKSNNVIADTAGAKEREAFDVFAKGWWWSEGGDENVEQVAWEAWQARAALASPAIDAAPDNSQAVAQKAARYDWLKANCLNNAVETDGKFGLPDFASVSFFWRRRKWKDGKPYVALEMDEAIDAEISGEKR